MTCKNKVQPRRLKGFQDYIPRIMNMRYKIMDAVRYEAALAGFQPIGTPALEYAEVLLGVGGETDKQVFRFMDNGERDVALRFDLTVPFARFVAEHQGQLYFPFKRMQIGDVWRAEKPQKGRYREFCQCDLDIIGVNSLEADVEILACFQNILGRLDVGPFTMAVGQRNLLSALITRTLGQQTEAAEQQALIIIDKLQKVGKDKVMAMLAELEGASQQGAEELLAAIEPDGDQGSNLTAVENVLGDDLTALAELEKLKNTVALVSQLSSASAGRVVIDLSIARGLGYYTGIVFETTLDLLPGFGSICSGGRYNQLVERYLNRELPGIGGSIGLDRLIAGLQELDKIPGETTSQTVFVALATDDAKAYGFQIAQALRSQGVSCDIALKTAKLNQQFKHADRMGYPYVVTVGSEEVQTQSVHLKEMATGHEERGLALGELSKVLREKLKLS